MSVYPRRAAGFITAVILSTLGIGSSAGEVGQSEAEAFAGIYQLEGVREVGADLQLRANGRFEFSIAYGGVDANAAGSWAVKGNTLTLTSDPIPPASFSLIAFRPELLDRYGTETGKPTLFVVKVSTPRLDMTWSNMEITAEFSNGQRRSGKTGETGMLGFLARPEAQWKNAVVKRVAVAYPKAKIGPVWFDVDSSTAKSIEVNFEPGAMTPPAFESLDLLSQNDGSTHALVVRSPNGPMNVGGRFVRR